MIKPIDKIPAVLLLEDGTVFHGKASGHVGTSSGELCFNTGMTGYQEIFTDPSYFGQIMVATNAHIGNYGVKDVEVESETIKISGLVCRNFSTNYSRIRATGSLQNYFETQSLVAISEADTRAIVRHIRDKGAMNAILSSETIDLVYLKNELSKVPNMAGLELSSTVSAKRPYFYGNENAKYRIAVLDLGVKKNILRSLSAQNCYMQIFPWNTSYAEMKKWNPNGFLISNGPGDPASMQNVVNTVGEIFENDNPTFGICLGHQILAEACGVKTFKMFNGHRGINHPVKNLITGHCEVTSQNHGFSISREDVEKSPILELTHVNLNDQTVEGIRVKGKRAFSVQYHPEASPGPHDSRNLFKQFVDTVRGN